MVKVHLQPGDIIRIDFDPTRGHEQAGYRPAIVLSVQKYNQQSGMVWVAPITSTVRGWPVEVTLPVGLKTSGAVRMDNVRALDLVERSWVKVEVVPTQVLTQCQAFIKAILGL